MKEVWRDIKGYEGAYQVSNLGRVRSLDREVRAGHGSMRRCKGTYLKPSVDKFTGYMVVTLSKSASLNTLPIHRFVMVTFKGESNLHVNHINGNKLDNRLENLEYVTRLRNTNHYYSDLKNKKYGVSFHKKTSTWRAYIKHNKKLKYLGSFNCKEEAHQAFYNAYLSLHGVKPW